MTDSIGAAKDRIIGARFRYGTALLRADGDSSDADVMREYAEHDRAIDALIAAVREQAYDNLRGATAWQQIETAPKDGTTVVVYDPTLNFDRVTMAAWDRDEATEGGQCWREDSHNFDRLNPTHWMPLPSPPASSRDLASGGAQ